MSAATPLFDAVSRYAPDDPCASRHKGAPTSEAAHESIRETKERTRRRILAYVKSCERFGATWWEISVALGLAYCNSGRVTELLASEDLVDSGRERKTGSGRAARVVVARGFAERQS